MRFGVTQHCNIVHHSTTYTMHIFLLRKRYQDEYCHPAMHSCTQRPCENVRRRQRTPGACTSLALEGFLGILETTVLSKTRFLSLAGPPFPFLFGPPRPSQLRGPLFLPLCSIVHHLSLWKPAYSDQQRMACTEGVSHTHPDRITSFPSLNT